MTDLAIFKIHLEPTAGDCRIEMDGQDVTAKVKSLSIHKAGAFEIPAVILEIPAQSIEVTGTGAAYLNNGPVDIAELIQSIDPQELEKEALERASFDDNLTVVMLQILAEKLSA